MTGASRPGRPPLAELVRAKRIVVCVGPGGVGKTSVAAAVALRAAEEGRTSLVVTFDPSRRLATSLGLAGLENEPRPMTPERFAASGLAPRGTLLAMHLDVKQTMDDLMRRHAPSPEHAERILANPLYQSLSTALPGAHEYMAMERLYALSQEDAYDLIVLDTPPASAALELLEAPDRVLAAFDRKTLRWIANPAVAAGRLGGELLRHLAPFTGGATLQALAQFLLALQDMVGGFRERAQAVQALLTADTTTFLLVSGADPAGVTEALDFYGVLRLHRVAVDGMVVNRVQPDWVAAADGADLSAPALVADFPGVLAGHLAAIVGEQQDLAAAHRDAVALLEDYLEPTTGVGVVPTLRDDPHDLAALAVVGRYLLDGRGPLPKSALPVA